MVDRCEGHQHRVQGVAYDPLGVFLASISSDRTIRLWAKGTKGRYVSHAMVREGLPTQPKLLSEAAYPYFFRRIAWSPDGSVLAVPSGHRIGESEAPFCSLLLHRNDLTRHAVVPPSVGSPSVGCRFAPELQGRGTPGWAPRRALLAVASASSLAVYDTEEFAPVAFCAGMHCASLTDAAWSPDARTLALTSQDGYVSFATLDDGEVGEVVPQTPVRCGGEKKEDKTTPAKVEIATPGRRVSPRASPASSPGRDKETSTPGAGKPKKRRVAVEIMEWPAELETEQKKRRVSFEVLSTPADV